LNKYDIKLKFCFQNCVNNQIIFLNVLWKDFNILNNHNLLLFTDEQIDCLWLSQILEYFFECHSLLNLCYQKEYSFELAWWLPLQLEHLKVWEHSSLFFILGLGGVSLLISFTTPNKLLVMYRLVRATAFDISHILNSVYICSVTLLPTILTLRNSRVHISTMNTSDVPTNIETSVDKSLGLCTTLGIPNVDSNDWHIQF